MRRIINHWFVVIMDYRKGHAVNYAKKVNLKRLRSGHCLCGHFELDGYFLHQRYPEVFVSERYKVFSFVRDPLQLSLSLYRYLKDSGLIKDIDIETHLFSRQNILAKSFCVTEDNYKEGLDKYIFIGVLEKGQLSMDLLARLIDKKSMKIPHENISSQRRESQLENLSEVVQKRFYEENKLDYLVYDHCLEKLDSLNITFEKLLLQSGK